MTPIPYTVKGRWPFPLDMLRHDDAVGATEEDKALIQLLSSDHLTDEIDPRREYEINLVGFNKPNTARWESFTWSVPGDEEHAFFKKVRERVQTEERLFRSALAKLTPEERRVVQLRINSREID